MKTIICKQCGKTTQKYNRDGSFFCNNQCYFNWKRINPNKKAYKNKIFVSGYYYLYKPSHPNAIKNGRYIAEHRYILEKKLGRLLGPQEIAHHINGDKTDNREENLELMTKKQHCRHNAKEKRRNKSGNFSLQI